MRIKTPASMADLESVRMIAIIRKAMMLILIRWSGVRDFSLKRNVFRNPPAPLSLPPLRRGGIPESKKMLGRNAIKKYP